MPKKMPIELLAERHKGKIAKATIEKRRAEEPAANSDRLEPPTFLDKRQAEVFRKYADELIRLKIIDNVDADLLGRYIVAHTLYARASRALQKSGAWHDKELLTAQNKYFDQCQACAKELGMTISSRCRLVIPKTEKKEPEKVTPFMEAFG